MHARIFSFRVLRRTLSPLSERTFATHSQATTFTQPSLRPSTVLGSLSALPNRDETPHLGTRFPASVQLSRLLAAQAPESDALLADLATLIARRGVVFFERQDITLDQQKQLALRMGRLSGAPASSGLHRHPISESTGELGADTSVISSEGGIARGGVVEDTRASKGWHSDITFEHIPAAFSILKMHTLPPLGGDTLWASAYEAYDRLSPAFATFLEGLTALHSAPFFLDQARAMGIPIQDPRGSPENTGSELMAIHPVVRTHPITNYKALFVNASFTTRILELHPDESAAVLAYLARHISENHDLQVRYRWAKDDVAIWDNRATLHTATNDYGRQRREGFRVVSIGERPFLDRASRSRREALGLR
ncbi:hypothetical protein K488DRAFT_88912 [Vararia minispora EC-137]|uniref:Uncharacterized protein n=1 Tax=Vararia minispora EC-137 TaxID=1314806 RepID=A0ACB8QBR3_9AGAM|nr:hypothetical protein K488DRAFT_88912 [Vararia minispora EC-137]